MPTPPSRRPRRTASARRSRRGAASSARASRCSRRPLPTPGTGTSGNAPTPSGSDQGARLLRQPRFARVLEVSPGLAVRKSPERFADVLEMLQFSARLHKIAGGESAIGLAEKYYKGHVAWGQDYRFYVNVLVFTNGGEQNQGKGISIDEDNDNYKDWKKVATKANYYIWIPSVEFAKALRGQVNSGSLTYQAYQNVKDFVMDALEWITFGLAYVGGLVVGILECVWHSRLRRDGYQDDLARLSAASRASIEIGLST